MIERPHPLRTSLLLFARSHYLERRDPLRAVANAGGFWQNLIEEDPGAGFFTGSRLWSAAVIFLTSHSLARPSGHARKCLCRLSVIPFSIQDTIAPDII